MSAGLRGVQAVQACHQHLYRGSGADAYLHLLLTAILAIILLFTLLPLRKVSVDVGSAS